MSVVRAEAGVLRHAAAELREHQQRHVVGAAYARQVVDEAAHRHGKAKLQHARQRGTAEVEQQQPQVDINLAMAAGGISDGIFEVTVTATVTTKVADKVLFLVEAKQAGIFEIRNIPQEQMQGILGMVCPQMIYPYLRAIVSDICTRAGFPPIMLTEVNFQAMYEAQQAQAAGNGAAPN